jgi:hypothetical protein
MKTAEAWLKYWTNAASEIAQHYNWLLNFIRDIQDDARPQWQPIATAPQDARILIFSPLGEVFAAQWAKNPWTDDVAWMVARLADNDTVIITNPTHWMPLPAPPKGGA